MTSSKNDKASENTSELYLPKPSLLIPIGCMLVAALGFGALTLVMSDIGHATGAAIAALLFLVAAIYMAVQSRR